MLDILKVIAAILIICVHCKFLFEYTKVGHHVTSNGIFRIPIPFFFTINGFFLYTVFQNDRMKFWVKRVGLLYLIWMLIFSYFWILPVYEEPLKIIPTALFGFTHLWYLAALFLGGILLYQLRKLSNTVLIVLALLLYLTGYTIQILSNFNVFTEPAVIVKILDFQPIHRNFLFFALPFLSIGYVMRRSNFHLKLKKTQVSILLVFSILLLITESLTNYYINPGAIFNMSISFLGLGPILLITAFSFKVNSNFNSKLLSSYSIALYLVHPLVLVLIYQFFNLDSITLTLVTVLLSGILSYLLILLNKKIKYIL
nr:acyltransferase [uncultured Kordia sp.]